MGAIQQREFDILKRGHPCKQIIGLKYQPNFAVANLGELIVIQFAYFDTVEPIRAAGRRIQTGNQVHKRGLA